jgi:Flp pilus assembly protein TadG
VRCRSDRGQGLVEFALVFPVFILLLLIVFDFGRAIYGYHTISNAARGGARVAIVDQSEERVRAAALTHTVGLNPDDVDIDLSALTTACTVLKIGCETEVTVSYAYRPLTPIISSIVGPIDLRSTTRSPIERVYVSPPAP